MADKKEEIQIAVEQLKKAYELLAQNKVVMEDLRNFCALSIPTDMSGKTPNLDINKVMVATGRATDMDRIDYFINTPKAQIVKQYLGV